jgi:hypothetical protein
MPHLKLLKKLEQDKQKISRRREIIKLRAKINKTRDQKKKKNKKTKDHKTKRCFFEKNKQN